ncbi:MAG: site-specific DNA-methyltransferase [Opitutae bacterium]|nr:site-specific DNA-methyltransferase [Opitutae bacterium]
MTSPASPERLPLSSPDLAAERLARLRELLPGAFTEGKLVPAKLAELVGAAALSATPERYGLSYAGRAEALREMLAPSPGTLRPDREKSVAWDATENLIVEGDNLHVLKLLQSAYAGAVKLIYIDPPYNTGNDFVYPDDFRAGVRHYKELTQQTLSTNAETSGRYHSDWLKMMHPRLALARNLLRDDGVIFVSIDDHEVQSLRPIMDEVFGEENFVAQLIWKRMDSPSRNDEDRKFSAYHEYLLVYARGDAEVGITREHRPGIVDAYPLTLPDGRKARRRQLRKNGKSAAREDRETMWYDLTAPDGTQVWPKDPVEGWEGRWALSRKTWDDRTADGMTEWIKRDYGWVPYYIETAPDAPTAPWSTIWDDVDQNRQAKAELNELMGSVTADMTPKPTSLLRKLIGLAAGPSDLILDFFAGSGTTGQAVLELNRQDGGNRKFILVQFPEPTGRADFPTIADITRERVRRVIKKLNTEDAENTEKQKAELPLSATSVASGLKKSVPGFRAYQLDDSNFKLWDTDAAPTDAAALAKQLELMAHNVLDGRGDDDLLAELLLKCGHPGVTLTSAVETREVAGAPVHLLAEGRLALCLARALTQEVLRGIVALKPQRVLCLDVGFHGNDQLKTNTVLEMKSHGVQFQTV